jgi:hypothetical protein
MLNSLPTHPQGSRGIDPGICSEVTKMAEKVQKVGVERVQGFLYYIDKQGDVSRAKMARGGKKGGKPEKVAKAGVKKQSGFLYFLDKKGDISRAKMVNA